MCGAVSAKFCTGLNQQTHWECCSGDPSSHNRQSHRKEVINAHKHVGQFLMSIRMNVKNNNKMAALCRVRTRSTNSFITDVVVETNRRTVWGRALWDDSVMTSQLKRRSQQTNCSLSALDLYNPPCLNVEGSDPDYRTHWVLSPDAFDFIRAAVPDVFTWSTLLQV